MPHGVDGPALHPRTDTRRLARVEFTLAPVTEWFMQMGWIARFDNNLPGI